MCKRLSSTFLFILIITQLLLGQTSINLSGEWRIRLDTTNELYLKHPEKCKMEGMIELPASLAEKGFGFRTDSSDYGVLTPEFKYIGKAWFSRDIETPEDWRGKKVELFLERVLWESRVMIDGIEISRQDGLGTPHVHPLGLLSPGKHKLTIQINNDMIHNIGDKGHAYGDYTQSIWNGIVGRMEMIAYDSIRISSLKVYPKISADELVLNLNISSEAQSNLKILYEILSLGTGELVLTKSQELSISVGDNKVSCTIPLNDQLEKWSEFNPEVYVLKASIVTEYSSAKYETEFGFYDVSHDGTKILVNGKPVFLRGNNDCVHFPLTGYPSCKVEDWERIFRIYKDYGLNHARFHSWTPPEAAFKAANRIGIYLQVEASIWIDWWMSEDMNLKGRPEMDTKGHPKGLGYDAMRDKFVIDEMNRVVDYYGNHPSFTMFCIGNELGNSDFEVMETWVDMLKAKDPRRLYAVSTARKITSVDDYSATHYIPGVGRTRGLNGANTNWDFEKVYAKMNIPIIAHEIGQWPVYPKWSEIEKYTGVLKARNFELFKKTAEKNGIAGQDIDFTNASGALNQLMYKYETESFLRTNSCAGVQLLSMQDYQGQGEALIGWLDAHWDSKDITTSKKFREHFTTTVPLLRMEKFVWTNDEQFEGLAQLSYHGEYPLKATCDWTIRDARDGIISKGSFGENTYALGSLSDLGAIHLNLKQFENAEKLTVSIQVRQTEFRNQWDIWVYPERLPDIEYGEVLITDKLVDEAQETLDSGGKVLLLAHELGSEETSVKALFYPLYWSLTFFPGQGKTCIGLLLKDEHPAFRNFATSYHSDWQWESISKDAKGFVLNDFPAKYMPIAQPVDDFHRNNKIGSIFEFAVGKGSILVCGYNLKEQIPVARQLKYSLLEYMKSSDFKPQQAADFHWLQTAMPEVPKAEIADVPDEFNGAILYVKAGKNATVQNESIPWNPKLDELVIDEKVTYSVIADGVWKDEISSAWHGEKMQLQINCPDGMLGSLYVHFRDWNNNNRSGMLNFEGRKVKLEKHAGEGLWVKFHVMREDSNDGKLLLNTNVLTGPNLMITEVVLVKE